MPRAAAAGLLWLAALAGGCQSHAANCAADPTIDAARSAWQTRHLEDYRFVWQQSCFCLPDAVQPIVVTVRHGEIVSATDRSGAPVSDEVRANLMTIAALYRYVDAAQCKADEIRVSATPDGVPNAVFVDRSRSIADEEFSVIISDFVALAP